MCRKKTESKGHGIELKVEINMRDGGKTGGVHGEKNYSNEGKIPTHENSHRGKILALFLYSNFLS